MNQPGAKDDLTSVPGAVGLRYVSSPEQPVSEWSDAVYRELRDRVEARTGRWEWWEPGYLVLRIEAHEGSPVEPVVLDTYADELTVTFGFWETQLPDDGSHDEDDSSRASAAARLLVSDWLDGRIATAIYFDADDKWCGSKLVENPEDTAPLSDITWLADFRPARVEVRKSKRVEWRHFHLKNGKLGEPA